jgi:hypothetical protein
LVDVDCNGHAACADGFSTERACANQRRQRSCSNRCCPTRQLSGAVHRLARCIRGCCPVGRHRRRLAVVEHPDPVQRKQSLCEPLPAASTSTGCPGQHHVALHGAVCCIHLPSPLFGSRHGCQRHRLVLNSLVAWGCRAGRHFLYWAPASEAAVPVLLCDSALDGGDRRTANCSRRHSPL